MNDDPGPSSAARQLPPRSDHDDEYDEYDAAERDADPDVHVDVDMGVAAQPHAETSSGTRSGDGPADGPAARQKEKEKRREGLVKKLELVSHLQKTLDMIVFVYICTLYYMECSFVRFVLRLLPHYSFLTPKDGLLLPAEQPHIYTIFLPSVLCILAHLFLALPEAGEATRGYLHGGVIIDFIGQKPPRSRLAFLLFDLVILGAQCLMLAVHQERERLKKAVSPSLQTIAPSGDQTEEAAAAAATAAAATAAGTTQDHDAEERGVLRDEAHMGDARDVELQPLSGSGSNNDGEEEDGRAADDEHGQGDTYSSAAASADLLDIIRSGNAVLANFHVIHAVRTVGTGAQGAAAAYSLRTFGYNATLAALAAERRSRLIRGQG